MEVVRQLYCIFWIHCIFKLLLRENTFLYSLYTSFYSLWFFTELYLLIKKKTAPCAASTSNIPFGTCFRDVASKNVKIVPLFWQSKSLRAALGICLWRGARGSLPSPSWLTSLPSHLFRRLGEEISLLKSLKFEGSFRAGSRKLNLVPLIILSGIFQRRKFSWVLILGINLDRKILLWIGGWLFGSLQQFQNRPLFCSWWWRTFIHWGSFG